jgi:predicted alpha/beta superfamily hydrolase
MVQKVTVMTKFFSLIGLLFLLISCNQNHGTREQTDKTEKQTTFRMYSNDVADSFSIFVNLPNNYNPQQKDKYPVVYLLDANLYFNIIATIITKYSEVGLAPSVILVGLGYKDFPIMDSLRNRDYTYPTAIPEYQMSVSGGANKFLSFINNDLIPHIDKYYKTDTSQRVLMGHSLGGYFIGYTLLQDLMGKCNSFSSYIAASPSIHYNKYYLLNRFKEIATQKDRRKKIKTYITYGGQEDAESKTDSSIMRLNNLTSQLSDLFSVKHSKYLIYKSDIYSNLDHMDTQIPTFIKGLQWTLSENK